MAITDYKITDQQIAEKGVVAAPDMLTGTAQENKGVFDRLVRETVAPAFNSMVDALADENEQRNADEATRKTQETARVAAEELRVAAENGRVAAETARETAERQRADETAGIVAQATRQAAAAEAAKTAAEDAREETIGHKNAAYWYAQDAAASKNAAAESATAAGQQAGSASGFAVRAEEALSKMGVHIGADTPANGAKLWLCPVNNPLVMNPDRATSDMTQEVGVNDDGKLVTTVEDGSISESKLAQDVKDKFRSLSEEIVTTSESKVAVHNTGTDTHSDIRLLIQGLTDRLNALADSDDTTLDQLSEIVAYIKSNRDLIAAITTDKVGVADIVNDLVTNVANKPLSAAQGVALKALIDTISLPTPTAEDVGKVPVVLEDLSYGLGGISGGEGEGRLICDITLSEEANSIEITSDSDGNSFELSEVWIYYDGSCTNASNAYFSVSSAEANYPRWIWSQSGASLSGTARKGMAHGRLIAPGVVSGEIIAINSNEMPCAISAYNVPVSAYEDKITSLKLFTNSSFSYAFEAGFRVRVYGR